MSRKKLSKKEQEFKRRSKASKLGWKRRKLREGLAKEERKVKTVKLLGKGRKAKADQKEIANLKKKLAELKKKLSKARKDIELTKKEKTKVLSEYEKGAGKLLVKMIESRKDVERTLADRIELERESKRVKEMVSQWPQRKDTHFMKQDGSISIRPSIIRTFDLIEQERILFDLGKYSKRYGGNKESPSDFRAVAEAMALEYNITDVREIYDFFYSP
jgi:hypothetical protein